MNTKEGKRNLTAKQKKEIIDHASHSIYRMNAKTAGFYAFTLDWYEGKRSWHGGWEWDIKDCDEDYALNLETLEFINLKERR